MRTRLAKTDPSSIDIGLLEDTQEDRNCYGLET